MPTISYTLRVVVPDAIDANILDDIDEDAEAHDTTTEAKIQRYLGGTLSITEDALCDALPEGWYAKIEEAS